MCICVFVVCVDVGDVAVAEVDAADAHAGAEAGHDDVADGYAADVVGL